MAENATTAVTIERMHATGDSMIARDAVAVEEPLEIRIDVPAHGESVPKAVSVTMRTPGHDAELAAGFLFTEGIVGDRAAIEGIESAVPNTIVVRLGRNAADLARLERHFYATSSCGVCGKASMDAVRTVSRYPLTAGEPIIDVALVRALPDMLRAAQSGFDETGGLHAAGLFSADGDLCSLYEDVGRHNALDKVIGGELLGDRLPAHDRLLVVSGRASFELVQKAVMAGIPSLIAVGAPSSLAVELATCTGMTLIGFARGNQFNVYAGPERVIRRA